MRLAVVSPQAPVSDRSVGIAYLEKFTFLARLLALSLHSTSKWPGTHTNIIQFFWFKEARER